MMWQKIPTKKSEMLTQKSGPNHCGAEEPSDLWIFALKFISHKPPKKKASWSISRPSNTHGSSWFHGDLSQKQAQNRQNCVPQTICAKELRGNWHQKEIAAVIKSLFLVVALLAVCRADWNSSSTWDVEQAEKVRRTTPETTGELQTQQKTVENL